MQSYLVEMPASISDADRSNGLAVRTVIRRPELTFAAHSRMRTTDPSKSNLKRTSSETFLRHRMADTGDIVGVEHEEALAPPAPTSLPPSAPLA
jgi:hypothetical protein